MRLFLNHVVKPIRGGFEARAVEVTLVAHGQSPEMARRSLERVARSVFAPFERDGTLSDELRLAGLTGEDDGQGLTVVVVG